MTQDITEYDEDEQTKDSANDAGSPPLCLVHYFAERGAYPPERNPKPPGREVGRVVERHGNLIILEFAVPPESAGTKLREGERAARIYDALVILLLLACLLGCFAAFRF